ncbi:MAG: nucleotidyltransferase domain-containing protein [Deltaproteobacteria bacterium]
MTEPFGLSEPTTERIQQVVDRNPEVRQVTLDGTRPTGKPPEGSDIDLSLKGSQLTHRHQLQISEAIENLLLPYRVDLSIYDSLPIPLKEHIQRVGQLFFQQDP